MLTSILQDLKHGWRMLVKNPSFALVAIVSIAIGVGANAAMFSVADTLVLRPLTIPRANEIVTVTAVLPPSGFVPPQTAALSYPDYIDVRDQSQSFTSLVAYRLVVATFATRANDLARRAFGVAVSGNLFDTLGVPPELGRTFGVEEDRVVGRNAVVVLDHTTWVRDFAADVNAIGRTVRIGGIEMTVIGVMPRSFSGPDQFLLPGYYIPMAMLPRLQSLPPDELTRRDMRNLAVKGFLRPGVSIRRATEDVELIAGMLRKGYPDSNRNQGLAVAAISALASSLVPAWQATRLDLVTTLKNQAAMDPGRSRLWGRNTLVSGQVAMSLVLLTVAVFLYRGFAIELGRGPGYRIDHVLLASFDPDLASYDAAGAERFYRAERQRARASGREVRGPHVIRPHGRHQHREQSTGTRRVCAAVRYNIRSGTLGACRRRLFRHARYQHSRRASVSPV